MEKSPRSPLTIRDRIRERALDILAMHPHGMPYRRLVEEVVEPEPFLNPATVGHYVADAEETFGAKVYTVLLGDSSGSPHSATSNWPSPRRAPSKAASKSDDAR